MRILSLLLVVALAVTGCTRSKSDATSRGALRAADSTPAPEAEPAPARASSIVVKVRQGDGALAPLLAQHATKAKAAGMHPYVEYSAEWCKPCLAFKKYLHDPQMQRALTGTYIIVVDFDAYSEDAVAMGVTGIPTWLELDAQGKPTGRMISSGVWEEDIPANMAPPLTAFFAAAK